MVSKQANHGRRSHSTSTPSHSARSSNTRASPPNSRALHQQNGNSTDPALAPETSATHNGQQASSQSHPSYCHTNYPQRGPYYSTNTQYGNTQPEAFVLFGSASPYQQTNRFPYDTPYIAQSNYSYTTSSIQANAGSISNSSYGSQSYGGPFPVSITSYDVSLRVNDLAYVGSQFDDVLGEGHGQGMDAKRK